MLYSVRRGYGVDLQVVSDAARAGDTSRSRLRRSFTAASSLQRVDLGQVYHGPRLSQSPFPDRTVTFFPQEMNPRMTEPDSLPCTIRRHAL